MRNITHYLTLLFLAIFILTGCNSENNKNTKDKGEQNENE